MRKLFILPLLLLSACGGGPKFGAPGSAAHIVDSKELPAPALADTQDVRSYLIGPFDKLSVEVFRLPELSRDLVQVGADGVLTYPLVGNLDAAGKTAAQLEAMIADRLKGRYLRNPQITVNVKDTITQTVTVEGQVQQPGVYPVIGRMSLIRTVAVARGTTENADAKEVVVLRTVNGEKMAAMYNLAAIRKGIYADPNIYANDVVIVGDSAQRRFLKEALGAISTLSYPIIATIQTLNN